MVQQLKDLVLSSGGGSDLTPGLGISISCGCGQKKKKKRERIENSIEFSQKTKKRINI